MSKAISAKERKLAKEKKLAIATGLILSGQIAQFKDLFNYIDRKYIHQRTGMNYYRLLRNIKNPKRFTFVDVYNIAWVMKVPVRNVAELIINQIEAATKIR